jgi:hypothetical protein
LSELDQPDSRPQLPEGWGWADWSGAPETRRMWEEELDERWRQRLIHRFREILAAIECHRPLPREKVHYDRGIGKAKVLTPRPGCRAVFFRDRQLRCITHFSRKGEQDHDEQITTALRARAEHMRRKELERPR